MSSHSSSSSVTSFDPNAAASPDSGIFGLTTPEAQARVVLLPVPFEATTSYGGGASDGPDAILQASRQIDLFDIQTGRPYAAGIAMLPEPGDIRTWDKEARGLAAPVIAAGGALGDHAFLEGLLARVNALGGRVNEVVRRRTAELLAQGKTVGVIGGDHSVPFGAIQAHAERFPGMGILHIDAHADLRTAYGGFEWSHASIMANVVEKIPDVSRLVQVGLRDLCEEEFDRIRESEGRIIAHFDAALQGRRFSGTPWSQLVAEVIEDLPQQVYVSFDIDGLDPTLCPHTGTPVPGGLSFAQAVSLIEAVAVSGRRIVGFDLCEVAPGPGGDEWDGNVGARLLYKLIGFTLLSQGVGAWPVLSGTPRRPVAT